MNIWNDIWSIVWFFFWSYAFIAYLFAIVAVLGDVFVDRTLNGWGKAAWMIFLIFVPFLTVLVYVIARGEGMATRKVKASAADRAESDDYIRTVAGSSPAGEIGQAKALLDAGTITQDEYTHIKAKVLQG